MLQPGNEGEIRFKMPKDAAARYLVGMAEQTALRDGWFYPGDIGRIDEANQLIITGRKSLVINLGGNKVSPELAESLIMEMETIDDVGVLGVKDNNGFDVVFALIAGDPKIDLDQVNRHLYEKKSNFAVSKLKHVRSIPHTDTGKVDRPALRELID